MRGRPSPLLWIAVGAAILAGYVVFKPAAPKSDLEIDPGAIPSSPPPAISLPKAASRDSRVPDWVPIYPGTTPEEITEKRTDYEYSLGFRLTPKGGNCRDYLNFYKTKLTEAGFHVHNPLDTNGIAGTVGFCPSSVSGEGPGHSRSITMSGGNTANGFTIDISVLQRSISGRPIGAVTGTVNLPAWVPIYPGSTPEFMNETGGAGERRIAYSFRSTDDARQVVHWFEDKLTGMGFRVSADYTPSNGPTLRSTAREDNRLFNVDAAIPGTAPMFHVELIDRP